MGASPLHCGHREVCPDTLVVRLYIFSLLLGLQLQDDFDFLDNIFSSLIAHRPGYDTYRNAPSQASRANAYTYLERWGLIWLEGKPWLVLRCYCSVFVRTEAHTEDDKRPRARNSYQLIVTVWQPHHSLLQVLEWISARSHEIKASCHIFSRKHPSLLPSSLIVPRFLPKKMPLCRVDIRRYAAPCCKTAMGLFFLFHTIPNA